MNLIAICSGFELFKPKKCKFPNLTPLTVVVLMAIVSSAEVAVLDLTLTPAPCPTNTEPPTHVQCGNKECVRGDK